jgi:hypothetical protein
LDIRIKRDRFNICLSPRLKVSLKRIDQIFDILHDSVILLQPMCWI